MAEFRKAQVVVFQLAESPGAFEETRGRQGHNQMAHLRELARQYRASLTREIVQC